MVVCNPLSYYEVRSIYCVASASLVLNRVTDTIRMYFLFQINVLYLQCNN